MLCYLHTWKPSLKKQRVVQFRNFPFVLFEIFWILFLRKGRRKKETKRLSKKWSSKISQ